MRTLVLALATLIPLTQAQAQQSCRAEIGEARARVLVDRCTDISPATHPPCNATNPCSLIQAEITRGCQFANTDKPKYCP